MFSQQTILTENECTSLVDLYEEKCDNTFRLEWDWESRKQELYRIHPESEWGKLIFDRLLDKHEAVIDDLDLDYFDPHLVEIFISKYVVGEGVGWHNDRMYYEYEPPYINERVYNFSVRLNDDFTGGALWAEGTEIPSSELGISNMFSIKTLHCVRPIESGVRYSLIGWMYKVK